MIEVVLNSSTTAAITRQEGGAVAAFSKTPLANWLMAHNPTPEEYQAAVTRFTYSCAGYCVATYVLGIGDRHNDNVRRTCVTRGWCSCAVTMNGWLTTSATRACV